MKASSSWKFLAVLFILLQQSWVAQKYSTLKAFSPYYFNVKDEEAERCECSHLWKRRCQFLVLTTDLKKKISKNRISFLLRRDPIPSRSEGDHECQKGESRVWTLMGCKWIGIRQHFCCPSQILSCEINVQCPQQWAPKSHLMSHHGYSLWVTGDPSSGTKNWPSLLLTFKA